jgi:hypothetical protein
MIIYEKRLLLHSLQSAIGELEDCRHRHHCHGAVVKLYPVESALEAEIHEMGIAESEAVIRNSSLITHHPSRSFPMEASQ